MEPNGVLPRGSRLMVWSCEGVAKLGSADTVHSVWVGSFSGGGHGGVLKKEGGYVREVLVLGCEGSGVV